jgi:RHS repeat-associated protein
VPGTPSQPFYYGIDQIGSVRRAFASPTSAPAYSYDPYGVPLQATAPVTDFVYGGMFYNADSGLYLTTYRAYDPAAGRWLSRDPIGEKADPKGNLYAYVRGNPVGATDALGLLALTIPKLSNPQPVATDPCPGNGSVAVPPYSSGMSHQITLSGLLEPSPSAGADTDSTASRNDIVNVAANEQSYINSLAKRLGMDRYGLGDALHAIKGAAGLAPSDNVKVLVPSGDVYFGTEYIGNVRGE